MTAAVTMSEANLTAAVLEQRRLTTTTDVRGRTPEALSARSGGAHTPTLATTAAEEANHRPVHLGVSMQWVACPRRSWIIRQHFIGSK
jgi:hypothetical protein